MACAKSTTRWSRASSAASCAHVGEVKTSRTESVTSNVSLSLFAYRVPVTTQSANWSFYFGAGPAFNFIKEGFENEDATDDDDFSFDDFDFEAGLNILAGIQSRNGMFLELKSSAYSKPAIRFIVGYSF